VIFHQAEPFAMLGRANAGRGRLCGGIKFLRAFAFERRLAKFEPFGESHSRYVGAQSGGRLRSRVTRGHVTTYRPEHVVNRADRTPVAVGPR